jgi:uncharacterized protein
LLASLSLLLPIFLGFFVGAVLALTGAGGAILSVPLLVFFIGLTIVEAAPVALLALAISASIATVIGFKKGIVRYKSAALMATLGVLFAPLGVKLSGVLPVAILSILFSLVLIFVGMRIVIAHLAECKPNAEPNNDSKTINPADDGREVIIPITQINSDVSDKPAPICQINPVTSRLFWTARCTARLSLTGVVAGLMSGLLGVGGGFIVVPALRAVSNFNMVVIIATSLTVVAFVSAAGFASYALIGDINWLLAMTFAAGTLLGLLSVTTVAHLMPSYMAQLMFALLAIIIALKMLYQEIAIFMQP